jgi:hypothetical protein
MITANIELFKGKKLSGGGHPIMLRITVDRKNKYYSTHYATQTEYWDEGKCRVKKNHPDHKIINLKIAQIESTTLTAIQKCELNNIIPTHDVLEKMIFSKNNVTSVFSYLKKRIDDLKKTGSLKILELITK